KKTEEKALPTLDHPVQWPVVRIHSVVALQSNKKTEEKALPTLDHPVQWPAVRIHIIVKHIR
ncbi:MAG: hypothetical protein ACTINA_09945, partial [Pseudoalteromonas distincta]